MSTTTISLPIPFILTKAWSASAPILVLPGFRPVYMANKRGLARGMLGCAAMLANSQPPHWTENRNVAFSVHLGCVRARLRSCGWPCRRPDAAAGEAGHKRLDADSGGK